MGEAEVYHVGVHYWLNDGEVNYQAYLAGWSSATSRKIEFRPTQSEPDKLYYYSKGYKDSGGALLISDAVKQ